MQFPTTNQKARGKGWPQGKSWLLYGPGKIGKTELASFFPKPLLIELELRGAEEISRCPVWEPKSMDELSECYDKLEGPVGKQFDTIIIDTLDEAYDWIEPEAMEDLAKKLKIPALANLPCGSAPNGMDWAECRKRMMGFMHAWSKLGKTIVFIAHSNAVMEEKDVIAKKAMTIDIPGKTGRRIPAKVDIVAYCYGVKEQDKLTKKPVINRYISFQPYEDLAAGCRLKELSGKILPMSFKAIQDCFTK